MRVLAIRWLWWALIWDMMRYCIYNPWRIFVALPLALVGILCVAVFDVDIWRERVWWNMCQCWDAVEEGEIKAPPEWLARKLDPIKYHLLGERP